MKRPYLISLAILCAVAALGMMGCSDDDDDDSSTTPASTNAASTNATASATGTWGGAFGTAVGFTMALNQTGTSLSGTYMSQGIPGTLTGSTSAGDINMTVTAGTSTATQVVAQWSGTINDAMNYAAGTFTIVSGGGGNGNWSMSR